MKKLLSSLFVTSCLVGVHFNTADAADVALKRSGIHYNHRNLGYAHRAAVRPGKAHSYVGKRKTAYTSARKAVEYNTGSYNANAASAVGHAADKVTGAVNNAVNNTAAAVGTAATASTVTGNASAAANTAAKAASTVGNAAAVSAHKALATTGNTANKAMYYARAAVEKTKGYARSAMEYARSYTGRSQLRGGDYGKHAGWWTNYQRPSYQRAWKPGLSQKK